MLLYLYNVHLRAFAFKRQFFFFFLLARSNLIQRRIRTQVRHLPSIGLVSVPSEPPRCGAPQMPGQFHDLGMIGMENGHRSVLLPLKGYDTS